MDFFPGTCIVHPYWGHCDIFRVHHWETLSKLCGLRGLSFWSTPSGNVKNIATEIVNAFTVHTIISSIFPFYIPTAEFSLSLIYPKFTHQINHWNFFLTIAIGLWGTLSLTNHTTANSWVTWFYNLQHDDEPLNVYGFFGGTIGYSIFRSQAAGAFCLRLPSSDESPNEITCGVSMGQVIHQQWYIHNIYIIFTIIYNQHMLIYCIHMCALWIHATKYAHYANDPRVWLRL